MAFKHSQCLALALLLALAVAAVTAWSDDHEVRTPGVGGHLVHTWAVYDSVDEHASLRPGRQLQTSKSFDLCGHKHKHSRCLKVAASSV